MNVFSAAWSVAFGWLVAVNLLAFGLGFLTLTSPRVRRAFFKAPTIVQKLIVPLVMVPLWVLPLAPQPTLTFIPLGVAVPAGLACVLTAVLIWVGALRVIGFIPGIRPAKGLVCTGMYGVVRHPIYLGNTLSVLGMALIFRAAGALLYVLVVAALFLCIVRVEERDLRAEYGEEYSAYARKVKYRLIPRLF
jgi:protein-S-isoprenylcysteine O-methyltransferase Ste14